MTTAGACHAAQLWRTSIRMNPATTDQPRVTANPGPLGGPRYAYRGAVMDANDKATLFSLRLDGLPGNWASLGSLAACVRICDAWLDTKRLPAPYVTPG